MTKGQLPIKTIALSLVSQGTGPDFLYPLRPTLTTTLTNEGSQPCIIWPGWTPSSAHKSLSYNSHLFYQLPNIQKKHSHILCNLISVIFRLSKAQSSEQGTYLPRFKGRTGLSSSPENWSSEQRIEAEQILTLTRPLGWGLISMEGLSFQYTEARDLLNIESKATSNHTPPHTVPSLAR